MSGAFDAPARLARDAAFSQFGAPVRIDPDGSPREVLARLFGAAANSDFGRTQIASDAMTMRFKAEEAPVRGDLIATLDAVGGAEVARFRVQSEPAHVDQRRLQMDVDTRPAS